MALGLVLGGAVRWRIEAADSRADRVLAHLGALAGLGDAGDPQAARILVHGGSAAPADGQESPVANLECAPDAGDVEYFPESVALPDLSCHLPPEGLISDGAAALRVLNVPARLALLRGGVLLHAALVAHEGRGYLLAGRSEAGKTTASRRVPPPWEALCDDMALAVRDPGGRWVVHPWPTWGAVVNGAGGSWPIERALPVAGVFFLEQAQAEEARRVGGGEASCLLNEAAEQASWIVTDGMSADGLRALRLRQFDSVAQVARDVPCFVLRLGLRGAFWDTMLAALGGGG